MITDSCEPALASSRMSRIVVGLVVGLAFTGVAAAQEASPARWPAPDAPLVLPAKVTPKRIRPIRLFLDAGHGAPGNTGNRSVTCEDEAAHTLRVAQDLARRLERGGRFIVKQSRRPGELVRYQRRLADAVAFKAEAFVSLHSDARGTAEWWSPRAGATCLRNDADPGFGVLVSDDGPKRLVSKRFRLGRALARRLGEAGFPAYHGLDWLALYAADEGEPGVFVDRRPPRQRVFVLRRPRIPSVIIETHHALDLAESARWTEERTLASFAAAVEAALLDALR